MNPRSIKRKEKIHLIIIISIPGLFLGILLKSSLFSTYRIKVNVVHYAVDPYHAAVILDLKRGWTGRGR